LECLLFLSDRWNRSGREEYERQIAEFRILNAAISSLAPEDAQRLIFRAPTNLLAEELSDLLGAKVNVAPIALPYGDSGLYSSPKPNRGTWMAKQIEAGRAAGTIFEDLEPDSIARAIARCVVDLESLQQSAQALSIEWSNKGGISGFVDFIEEQIAFRAR